MTFNLIFPNSVKTIDILNISNKQSNIKKK